MTKTSAKRKVTGSKRPSALPSRNATTSPRNATAKASAAVPTEGTKATKMGSLIAQLRQGRGASLTEIADATGWQHHSIRGAISGHIKKKLGLKVASTKDDEGVRRYRIAG